MSGQDVHSPTASIAASARRQIGLLCLSAIPDDPRVRRQGDAMQAAGWDVLAFGLPGHRSLAPSWRSFTIDPDTRHLLSMQAARRFVTRVKAAYRIARTHAQPSYACRAYWGADKRFDELYRLAREHRPDIWLANDWNTIPIAARLAAEQGVPYAYDTHEFAADEYAQSLKWRVLHQNLTVGVEGAMIGGAAFVTCVSDGIADRLQEFYNLPLRPTVIRNTPPYEPHAFRRTGDRIAVLYHGVVSPGRGLEACIASVTQWRPEFHFVIRGPALSHYQSELESIVHNEGLNARVEFHPPVPMTELVTHAANADVGLFALPDHSLQNVYVLPNKFFEYTMAGLALCVSDLPEMTRLLRAYDLGVLIEELTPDAISKAVNSLDAARIDEFKEQSLRAAKVLAWDVEQQKLVEICEQALAGRAARSQVASTS